MRDDVRAGLARMLDLVADLPGQLWIHASTLRTAHAVQMSASRLRASRSLLHPHTHAGPGNNGIGGQGGQNIHNEKLSTSLSETQAIRRIYVNFHTSER